MSDITPDEVDNIELEDIGFDLEPTEAEETQASESEEKESPEVESEPEQPEVEAEEETDGEDAEESKEPEAAEETDPEETRKEAARQAYQDRQARRAERENAIVEAREADLQQIAEQGADDEQIAIKELQWVNYQNTVTNNVDRLQTQFEQAKNSIEIFKNPSPAIQSLLDDAIDEFQAKNVSLDKLGNPINVRGNLTDFLTVKAGLIESLVRHGEAEAKKNVAKAKAATTPKPNGSPRQAKSDKDLDDFDRVFE
jgi:hypothetical protein